MIPPARRDKYQRQLKWYWVDIATTGSFQDENEEQFVDKTAAEGEACSFDVGLAPFDPNVQVPGDEPEVGSDDDDDDSDNGSGSTRTRGRVPGKNDVEMEYALEAGYSG